MITCQLQEDQISILLGDVTFLIQDHVLLDNTNVVDELCQKITNQSTHKLPVKSDHLVIMVLCSSDVFFNKLRPKILYSLEDGLKNELSLFIR